MLYIATILKSPMLFFCTITPTPALYTLSLHDALPIYALADETLIDPLSGNAVLNGIPIELAAASSIGMPLRTDRKSTRLNSSHVRISYAVFCLKKKKKLLTVLSLTRIHSTKLLHSSPY